METATATRVPSPTEQVADVQTDENIPAVHRGNEQLPAGAEQALPGTEPEMPHKALQGFDKIAAAIAGVMAEIKGVGKGGTNEFHHYKYARMQDILTVLTPLIGKHGLVIFQTEHHRSLFDNGNVIAVQYRFTIAHASGQVWPEHPLQTGMSFCRDSKGKYDDKSLNKAHTAARKYFLLALFQVPTEDEDADVGPKERANTPVPGPSGHVPPYRLDPARGEKFTAWAARYQKAIAGSKTSEELSEWDSLNDDLLTQLGGGNPELYAKVMHTVAEVQAKFSPPTQKDDPISTGVPRRDTVVPSAPSARPEGCPNAEKYPDAFVDWATKRLRKVAERRNADELTTIWESEITPASDGLFKPDCDALQALYDGLLAKIGG